MLTSAQKRQKEQNKLSLNTGFQQIKETFSVLFTSRVDPFIVAFLLALLSVLLIWQWDAFRFFFIFVLLLLLELIVSESALKTVRFFQLHHQFRRTFYFLLFITGFLNILAGKYFGYQAMSPFLGVSLITVLIGKRAGQISAIFLSSFLILLFPSHSAFSFFLIISGYLTAQLVSKVDRRIELSFHALLITLFNLGGYFFLVLSNFEIFSMRSLILIGVTSIVSTVLVIGMLPYIEWISRIYSNIGMLELGNLNHSLLKDMMQKAPGTYFHSFMLSNLSEAAAERIGVNPILARVGAYFHDIGKTKKPDFFTENQMEDNPHNRLNPSMSYLVLTEHVKFGGELARKYRLPILFEDLIYQHHGTRVQKFFYNKAKNKDTETSDDQYRYSG
ncbi:MAG: HDIG domain-containing metalloprotein, partial [Thermotogota bacterium]